MIKAMNRRRFFIHLVLQFDWRWNGIGIGIFAYRYSHRHITRACLLERALHLSFVRT